MRLSVSELLSDSLNHFWKKWNPFQFFNQQILFLDGCKSKSVRFQELLLQSILQIKTINCKKVASSWRKQIFAQWTFFVDKILEGGFFRHVACFQQFSWRKKFNELLKHDRKPSGNVWHNPFVAFTRNFFLLKNFKNCFHFCNIDICRSFIS